MRRRLVPTPRDGEQVVGGHAQPLGTGEDDPGLPVRRLARAVLPGGQHVEQLRRRTEQHLMHVVGQPEQRLACGDARPPQARAEDVREGVGRLVPPVAHRLRQRAAVAQAAGTDVTQRVVRHDLRRGMRPVVRPHRADENVRRRRRRQAVKVVRRRDLVEPRQDAADAKRPLATDHAGDHRGAVEHVDEVFPFDVAPDDGRPLDAHLRATLRVRVHRPAVGVPPPPPRLAVVGDVLPDLRRTPPERLLPERLGQRGDHVRRGLRTHSASPFGLPYRPITARRLGTPAVNVDAVRRAQPAGQDAAG